MELNEFSYRASKASIEKFPTIIKQQTETLQNMGLSLEEIERALAPTITFMESIKEDVLRYEQKRQQGNN